MRALMLLVVLAAMSCEVSPADRYEPVLNVHCMLICGDTYPEVWVNRTYALDETVVPYLDGVTVRLWRGADTWHFRPGEYHSQYRSADRVRAVPGDTFGLMVAHPEFDTVWGQTVVPDTFSILWPRLGDTVRLDDSVVMTRSRSCRGYFMSARYFLGRDTIWFYRALPNESLPALGYDSLYVRFPTAFLAGEHEGPYTFRVAALDSNYFDWVSNGIASPSEQYTTLAAGITGGVGVFGAAAICSVRFYLKKNQNNLARRDPQVAGSAGGVSSSLSLASSSSRLTGLARTVSAPASSAALTSLSRTRPESTIIGALNDLSRLNIVQTW
ncbi:MAG: DUF4249 family protein [candidate division WOR-3 bacterium]